MDDGSSPQVKWQLTNKKMLTDRCWQFDSLQYYHFDTFFQISMSITYEYDSRSICKKQATKTFFLELIACVFCFIKKHCNLRNNNISNWKRGNIVYYVWNRSYSYLRKYRNLSRMTWKLTDHFQNLKIWPWLEVILVISVSLARVASAIRFA